MVENPYESLAWQGHPLQKLLKDPRFTKIRLDHCMVKLRDVAWPNSLFRKSTGLIVPKNTAMENIGVKCDGSHEHAWIIGGKRAKSAGAWTVEFAESIIGNALPEAVLHDSRFRSWLLFHDKVGEIKDQQSLYEIGRGLFLRTDVLRAFKGPGTGSDARVLVRQLGFVLSKDGALRGFSDTFLDRKTNDMEHANRGITQFVRNAQLPHVCHASPSYSQHLYVVEVFECAPAGVKATAMPGTRARGKTRRS